MAKPTFLSDKINDITECPICTDRMVDPKMLPCIHTFCFKCLARNWINKHPGDVVTCPMCRESFRIPSGGLGKLRSNFFVQQLIDLQKLNEEEVKCDDCLNKKIDHAATRECNNCLKAMCESCTIKHIIVVHMSAGDIRLHSPVSLDTDELKRTQQFNLFEKEFCNQHKENQLEIFCNVCKIAMCTRCFLSGHRKHDVSDITEVARRAKKHIEEDTFDIAGISVQIRKELRKIDTHRKQSEESTDDARARILKQVEEMKTLLDKHATALIENLIIEKIAKLQELAILENELKLIQKICFHGLTTYVERHLSNATLSQVAIVAEEIHATAELLLQTNITRIERYAGACFKPSDLEIYTMERRNLIGETSFPGLESTTIPSWRLIQPSQKQFRKYPRYSNSLKPLTGYASDPQLVAKLQFNSSVRGIAIAKQKLFVVCDGCNILRVFDADTWALEGKFPVEGLCDPWSMVATNDALFISGTDEGAIYQVNLSDISHLIVYNYKINGLFGRLAMTERGNILVSCESETVKGLYKICEYSFDGRKYLRKKITLPSRMGHLECAIQIEDDRILLAHANPQTHRVCLVNSDGLLIRCYGGAPGSGPGQLGGPCDLALDRNGNVLVCCFGSNKVVLLNSKLEYVKDILPTSANIRNNDRICLDESRGYLYVTNSDEMTISVFKLN